MNVKGFFDKLFDFIFLGFTIFLFKIKQAIYTNYKEILFFLVTK